MTKTTAIGVSLSLFAVLAACGSPETVASSPPQTPTASTSSAAVADMCSVHLYGASYDASCQRALDQTCCAEERACGADGACKSLMACLSGCPHGKGQDTERCVNACAPQKEKTPGFALFNDVATCSKKMPPSGDKCDWP
jgi:hypothetical protein